MEELFDTIATRVLHLITTAYLSTLYQEDGQLERSPKQSQSSQEAEPAIEMTQRFEHEQFLEQILQQGQSPKSQGKRIAVIGVKAKRQNLRPSSP